MPDRLDLNRLIFSLAVGLLFWTIWPLSAMAIWDQKAYEQSLIDRTLESLGLTPDPEPEGKIVEDIIVQRYPVIEPTDPWPDFLNIFHVTTKHYIVFQELLFSKGARYDPDKVLESERNLRDYSMLFSVVRFATARGEQPDRVKVVVITKDIWSLRLNMDFNIGGGVLDHFTLIPTEQNFLGLNQRVSLYTSVNRDTFSVGQTYEVPRLIGSRWSLSEALVMRLNQDSEKTEGGMGYLRVARPLFSLATRWGTLLEGNFDLGTQRQYDKSGVMEVQIEDEVLQRIYEFERYGFKALVMRSFGAHWKTTLQTGYSLRSERYSFPARFREVPPEIREAFRRGIMPLDLQAGELVGYAQLFEADYQKHTNVQAFGLTEDIRFGPTAFAEIDWANPAFGFDQGYVKLQLGLSYRGLLLSNILSIGMGGSIRKTAAPLFADVAELWIDRYLDVSFEHISPQLLRLGRSFLRVRYAFTQFNTKRALFSLGGDNTLRGFASAFRQGTRLVNVNWEFRSRPWIFHTVHLGFVVFYDGGDVYDYPPRNDFQYHNSLGLGLRTLFPQFNRVVLRIDAGFPLGADFHADLWRTWISASFLQAF